MLDDCTHVYKSLKIMAGCLESFNELRKPGVPFRRAPMGLSAAVPVAGNAIGWGDPKCK